MLVPILILVILGFFYTQYEQNKRNNFISNNKSNPIIREQKKLIDRIILKGNHIVTKERDNEIEIDISYDITKATFNISRSKEQNVSIKLKWEKNDEIGTELWIYKKNEVDENIIKIIDFINEKLI